jgi:xanthine dehydrogenase iron-sulfur cluster and FAD-binding subunit A
MSLFALYYMPARMSASPASDPAGETLAGNLCRCTGYRSLREASATLVSVGVNRQDDPFAARLSQPMPPRPAPNVVGGGVIAFRPTTVEEALSMRVANPEARVVAGATDVGVEISRGGKRFPAFIMLGSIDAMRGVSRDDAGTRIGACVTMTDLKAWVPAEQFPTIHKVLLWFGSRQIRNRATVGGNFMTASPIGDLSVTWLALDAEVLLQSRTNVRWVPVVSFFTGYRQTVATAEELLVAVRVRPRGVPLGGRRVEWVHKVARRDRVDISTVIAAYSIELDGAGVVTDARLAYGGVAAMPARAIAAEKSMIGNHWSDEGMADARTALATAFSPIDDVRATASYRARLVTNLFNRCLAETANAEQTSPASLAL